ncbi:MAG: NAD-dependent epimerase/dehydratase family protein [Lactobacillus sp.]|jgi:UDP-glucose 4-epimerase|nr:NAD-dependent epimerase/dehydratase family protein [Lactobacillus sp.]MCI2032620.1 NAD-dependent epimerase/dehydratase family protein [Lactobacillus sp.]
MAKYLVTGGAGFIGSNLVDTLVQEDNQIVVVDDLSMGLVENLPQSDKVRFLEHSITDHAFMRALLQEEHFDYIVLLAAIASVADSVERPYETHQVNQEANLNIIETIRQEQLPLKKLFFASSAAVYGDDPALPKQEEMAVKPLTQYAVDKYATERAIINYSRLYDLPFVAVRFFNVFGPKQNPSSPYSGVLSILLNALTHDLPFTFFGDGGQTRDFTFINDVVSAIVGLLHTPEAKGEVFNIANGQQTSLQAVATTMQQITGKTLAVSYQATRAGDIRDSYANVDKINALGFMTHTPLAEGLRAYVASVQ